MKRSLLMLSVLAALPSGYAYRSDTPMIMPDMSYLDELQRYNRYEDSLDIIDGNGSRFVDCSQMIKRFEQVNASCGSDYTGTITKTRKVYGSGTVLVRSSGKSSTGVLNNVSNNNVRRGGVASDADQLEDIEVPGYSNGYEVACSVTPDGYTSQWQETSNSCQYTPLCNATYEEEIAGTCPDGYTGTLTKSITYRSKYFGQKVTQSQCNSSFNKFNETTYNNCKEDVPPAINDEKIVKDATCNSQVSINGETGKWVKFGRGGNAFWLPMYTDYIEKYGVADFYEKIYNAKDKNILESEFNGCYILDDTYKNSSFDNEFLIKIDSTNANADFNVYKNAEYNLDLNNVLLIRPRYNYRIDDAITLSGSYIKMNNLGYFIDAQFADFSLNYKGDITLDNVKYSLISAPYKKVTVNAKNMYVNTLNDKIQKIKNGGYGGYTGSFNIQNEILAPKVKVDDYFKTLNAKKAVFYSVEDTKSYMGNPKDSSKNVWNVQKLETTSANDVVVRGDVIFNGDIKSPGRVFIYSVLNGDIYITDQASIVDEFNRHNGKVHNYNDPGYETRK